MFIASKNLLKPRSILSNCLDIKQTCLLRNYVTSVRKSKTIAEKRNQAAERRMKALVSQIQWDIGRGDNVFVRDAFPDELHPYKYKTFTPPTTLRPADLKGTTGKVLKVNRYNFTAIVEGVNIREKEIIDDRSLSPVIVKEPEPVPYNMLYLLDPVDKLPTKIDILYDQDTAEKLRVSQRSREIIPWPKTEIKQKGTYFNDTTQPEVEKITYDKYDELYTKKNMKLLNTKYKRVRRYMTEQSEQKPKPVTYRKINKLR